MGHRLKVLVSAFACNPYSGSEEGVGWGWVKALAKHHDLWIITTDFHRTAIERAIQDTPKSSSHLKFHFVTPKPWHFSPTKSWQFIEKSMFKPIMNCAYRLWQRDAFQVAKELHREFKFDIVHQLTYVGFRFPGLLWKLDLPFVWGPIGGLENAPWRFLPMLGTGGCFYYAGRNIINYLDKKFLPGPKKAFKKTRGGIIAATNGIRQEIFRWYGKESTVICEIGQPPNIARSHLIRKPGETLRLSWSGQHLPGKALPLLLYALVKLPSDLKWQMDILGNGPCTKKWRRLAGKLGLNYCCNWYGNLQRIEAISRVYQSHLFIITSMKDLTSTVLLEALSQGVPVICPDHCGFADVVTEECGIKIAVKTPRQLITDLATAIMLLEKDEEKRRRLAKGALQRIKDFSWEHKARQVDLIYRQMVNK